MIKQEWVGTDSLGADMTLSALNDAATFVVAYGDYVWMNATWAGTLTVVAEVSLDGGTNWVATSLYPLISATFMALGASSITASGAYKLDVRGASHIRFRCNSFTSGTATLTKVTLTQDAR